MPGATYCSGRMFRTRLSAVVLAILAGCSGSPVFVEADSSVQVVSQEELAYARSTPVELQDDRPTDAEGVRLYERNGQKYYHPVVLAQRGLELIESFRITEDDRYLIAAKSHADRLVAEATEVEEALYFPYTFDFALHGRDDAILGAPWYSAMAQGQALSLLVRLWEATGEETYLRSADQVFETFQRLENEGSEPWTVIVDDNGYLWLEEYPTPEKDHHAWNGHMFALFGLYDYYRATGNGEAELLGAVATVEQYFEEFRNPGGPSYYELRFGVTDEKYHGIHIRQLQTISDITGDPAFDEMSVVLACDLTPSSVERSTLDCP